MAQYVIDIRRNEFLPGSLRIEPGDSVVWDNQDPHDHAISGLSQRVRFDTGNIKAGSRSQPIVFPTGTSYGGVEFTCAYHGAMEGRLFVTAGNKSPGAAVTASFGARATAEPGLTYSVESWRAIARIVVGHWVYDMADNFLYSRNFVHTGDALAKLKAEWSEVEDFWRQQTGVSDTILDPEKFILFPSVFLNQSRDKLEALGRRMRLARRKLSRAGVRLLPYPLPARPDDPDSANPFGRLYGGQSDDPFGHAITANYAGLRGSMNAEGTFRTEVQDAEVRHEGYALGPLWAIEVTQDAGDEVTDQMKTDYKTARAELRVDDYHTLAAHQYFGLSKLFNSGELKEDQFVAGIQRMTVRGEWDGSWTPLWHWLRWIDGYITVKETGQLPDPFGALVA